MATSCNLGSSGLLRTVLKLSNKIKPDYRNTATY